MDRQQRNEELRLDAELFVLMYETKKLFTNDTIEQLIELNRQDDSKTSKKVVIWLTKTPGNATYNLLNKQS